MLRVLTALAGLLALLPAADAMVGGAQLAAQAIARHVVLIVSANGACTGVAIAPDLVLTAAHCVTEGRQVPDRRASMAIARPSSRSRASPRIRNSRHATTRRTWRWSSSPRTRRQTCFPVPFSDRRAPISVGDHFIVAGFGVSTPGDRRTAGKLRSATLVATGKPSTQIVSLIDPQTLGEKAGLGVCNGDSGGPVFERRDYKLTLVGVISWTGVHRRRAALRLHQRRHPAAALSLLDRRDRREARIAAGMIVDASVGGPRRAVPSL